MADVFISYSKSHAELTRALAKDLEAKGLSVWWDTDMVPGERFRQRILEEIKSAKALIVIWTVDSIHSDYVLSEAERGRVAGKLIQVRSPDVDPHDLPPPFDTSHVALIDDRDGIFAGLARFGLLPGFKPDPSKPLPVYGASRGRSRGLMGSPAIMSGVAVLGGAAVLLAAYQAGQPKAPASNEAQIANLAAMLVTQLGSGIPDSSLFAQDVRLGKRGLMTKLDAVAELRRAGAAYTRMNCRLEGQPEAVTATSGQDRTGTRTRVVSVCDLVDASGGTRTERIPLEVEMVPDAGGKLRVTGLWQPDKQLFWAHNR